MGPPLTGLHPPQPRQNLLQAAGNVGQASGELLQQIGESDTDPHFQVGDAPPPHTPPLHPSEFQLLGGDLLLNPVPVPCLWTGHSLLASQADAPVPGCQRSKDSQPLQPELTYWFPCGPHWWCP